MTRQVTLDVLKRYLEQFGWSRYKAVDEPLEQEGFIQTGWKSSAEAEGYTLVIDPMVEINCLSFRVPRVLEAPRESTPPQRLAELLMAMGFINYRMILGKFAYDARDGEVRFIVSVPIDNSDFTYEQFQHCLGVAVKMVEEYAPTLKAITAGEQTFQQFMEEEVTGEFAGTVEQMLRQLLEELEQRLGHRKQAEEGEGPLTEV